MVGAADADASLVLTWSAFGVIILSMYSLPLLATHSENWYYGRRRSMDGWVIISRKVDGKHTVHDASCVRFSNP